MAKRGQIQNRLLKNQVIDMSAFRYGKITPTDIDFLIEMQRNKNKGYVIGEVKREGAPVKQGQLIALQTLANDLSKAGKFVIAVIVDHTQHCTETFCPDIPLHECTVRQYYMRLPSGHISPAGWQQPKEQNKNAKVLIDAFLSETGVWKFGDVSA